MNPNIPQGVEDPIKVLVLARAKGSKTKHNKTPHKSSSCPASPRCSEKAPVTALKVRLSVAPHAAGE